MATRCYFYAKNYLETRLIPFGEEAGDRLAQNISVATKEIVSELVRVPVGFVVEGDSGHMRCKSFYVRICFVACIVTLALN